MRLFLIRHGASVHSKEKFVAGRLGCRGLTDEGKAQASKLAKRFEMTGELGEIDVFLSSPIQRARETADQLQPIIPVPLVELEALEELRPGEGDGLPWPDFWEKYGRFDMTVEVDRPFSPGGESWAMFSRRVVDTLTEFAERYDGKRVLAITHGGFVATSAVMQFQIPRPGSRAHLHANNTSIMEWVVRDGRWILIRFGDTAHLSLPI